MAVAATLTAGQRTTLAAVCDTFVPAIEADDDPFGLWRRSASETHLPEAVELALAEFSSEDLEGIRGFLDVLEEMNFAACPAARQEEIMNGFADFNPTKPGFHLFRALSTMLFYSLPSDGGINPNWRAIGYPGPPLPPHDPEPSNLRIRRLGPDEELEVDSCVIGSGSGGSVAAARLAGSGRRVLVLEAGAQYDPVTTPPLELIAYRQLYLRGGPFPTEEGQVVLLAASCLGGGTTVNYTNCLRTPARIRQEWEAAGLDGVSSPEFDRHLDAVLERIGATDQISDLNGPHLRLKEGCAELGYSFRLARRNADPTRYDPAIAGFMGFGDATGSKLDATRTWLKQACADGAEVAPECRAERVLLNRGGGAEVITEGGGTVRAREVVVAAGAIESPALLLRSGLGGASCGANLALHPSGLMLGVFEEPQQAWWGPPQAGLCDEFSDLGDGSGFLIECPHVSPGAAASSVPWRSGLQHKRQASKFPRTAALSALIRDSGPGSVSLGLGGTAHVRYRLDKPRDISAFLGGLQVMARILEAAGAEEIAGEDRMATTWRRGEDFDGFLAKIGSFSIEPYEHAVFSGHQMGTCRLGNDPNTSVANPVGELHDAPGVWIADASGFPSAAGVNPMVTTMALAHRTAEAICTSQ